MIHMNSQGRLSCDRQASAAACVSLLSYWTMFNNRSDRAANSQQNRQRHSRLLCLFLLRQHLRMTSITLVIWNAACQPLFFLIFGSDPRSFSRRLASRRRSAYISLCPPPVKHLFYVSFIFLQERIFILFRWIPQNPPFFVSRMSACSWKNFSFFLFFCPFFPFETLFDFFLDPFLRLKTGSKFRIAVQKFSKKVKKFLKGLVFSPRALLFFWFFRLRCRLRIHFFLIFISMTIKKVASLSKKRRHRLEGCPIMLCKGGGKLPS